MDPLLDEKFILTISQVLPPFFLEALDLRAVREAYGPSRNEGLCYENCTRVEFDGEVQGSLFFAMDGYTKLKLLPVIAGKYLSLHSGQIDAASVMLEFANQICSEMIEEMKQGRFEISLHPPENLNHRLYAIDPEKYRQYILIYHLLNPTKKESLGRVYLVLILQKY